MVYDCETQRLAAQVRGGWGNVEGMGLASAVIYSYNKDKYYFFLHQSSVNNILTLLDGNVCVSFNGVGFDSKLLLGNKRKLQQNDRNVLVRNRFNQWTEYDLFLKVVKAENKCHTDFAAINKRAKKGSSLDVICQKTIGHKKNDKGANAPALYAQKKYDQLLSYNQQDVRLTRKLFEHCNRTGSLIVGDGRHIPIQRYFFT